MDTERKFRHGYKRWTTSAMPYCVKNSERVITSKMNKYTLVILDYVADQVRIMLVDNDIIEEKWNNDVLEYITGDIAKGGLGYDRDQVEYMYSDEVSFDINTVTNCG